MPTDYTFFIENGSISTGKEFLKKCIRNFGCCINQRDDSLSAPLETKIQPNSYHRENYERSIKALERFDSLTKEEHLEARKTEAKRALEQNRRYLSDQKNLRERYLKVRHEVEQWTPPTKDHEGIKEFALEQIDKSIPTEVDLERIQSEIIINQVIANQSIDESDIENYIAQYRTSLERDISYYYDKMRKNEQLTNDRNKFINDFLWSLEKLKEDKK